MYTFYHVQWSFQLASKLLINRISILVKFYDLGEKFLHLFSHQNFLLPSTTRPRTFPWKFLLEILYRCHCKRVGDIFPFQRGSIAEVRPRLLAVKKGSGLRKMVGFEGKIVVSRIRVESILLRTAKRRRRRGKEETSMQSVTSHLFTTSIRWTCRNNLAR